MQRQIRLSILSNAGGTGKTTLAAHLAYALAKRGVEVTIIELDPSGSLKQFVGLLPAPEQESMAVVLTEDFDGRYPLKPIWEQYTKNVSVLQGGSALSKSIRLIEAVLPAKFKVLAEWLDEFPLKAKIVIIDTPATLEPMSLVALAASTHVLCTTKPEWKDSNGAAELVSWYHLNTRLLKLNPKPKVIGFVPMRVDLEDFAAHRNILGLEPVRGRTGAKRGKSGTQVQPKKNVDQTKTLPAVIKHLGFYCFPYIRESSDFVNASGRGVPLHVFRPGSPVVPSFEPIVESLIQALKEEKA